MKTEVLADSEAAGEKAAKMIMAAATTAISARGRFVLAVSGGTAPLPMFRALAKEPMPWQQVHVTQVDERVAPTGHPDRNLTHLREHLIERIPLPPENLHPMPVEDQDLRAAAARYAALLERIAGSPPVLDVAHLGIGPDGHTASLVPDDPVLEISNLDVALSGVYLGRKRMTMTFPMLNRSRHILWYVTGTEKAGVLARLLHADATIPAGRVSRDQALLVADRAAMGDNK